MNDCRQAFAEAGAAIPRLLLPNPSVDLHRFAVIACDQFSAQPEYWQQVEDLVGDAPSALRLMLPEAHLAADNTARIGRINSTMQDYLSTRVLTDVGEALVYLRRRISSGVRRGLMLALDLEQYDFSKDSKSLIRATEGTVLDRLPPRVAIRRDAFVEMPHIMVLIDDREDSLMGTLEEALPDLECLYDFTLMQGGGHLSGYRVDGPRLLMRVAGVLGALKSCAEDGLLYAMGDGNHSFATAKACWEELKPTLTEQERKTHPARYGLVELVNLYDPALKFEPIHRLLLHVDPARVQREVGFDARRPPSLQVLQPMLDEWFKEHPEAELEYIHGADDCRALEASAPDRLAVVFPGFDRDSLFEVVRRDGCFVRKSFSMGHARDKRYYLECRAIR